MSQQLHETATRSKNNPMQASTILVLGATGKVGKATAHLLADVNEVHTIAAVRSPEHATDLSERGIELRHLDLNRHDTLPAALTGVNRALLATSYSVDMLAQSKAFLDEAKRAGVEHIVHIGASGALTNEVPHWGWHQFIERYVESLGFSFTHLRPEAFMQNVTAFGWLKAGVITNYIGSSRWSWLDSDELARVAAETLLHPERYAGQTIPLGYESASMAEVAQIFTEVIGQPFQQRSCPAEEYLQTMIAKGAEPTYLKSTYTQFKLNIANAIPDADATFDNFEAMTAKKPTSWREFALKHRDVLAYQR